MDPLSEVLALLNTQSSFFAGLKAGGDWAIDFPAPDGIKFNAVVEGACWLSVEGVAQAIRLERGDCFLLSRRRTFSLRSDPGLPAVPADQVYRHAVQGIARCGTADGFFLIGGRFAFGEAAGLLVDGLPPVAVVKSGSEQAAVLSWALRRLAHELAHASPGGAIVIQHLGHIMLVEMLRLYLERAAMARRAGCWRSRILASARRSRRSTPIPRASGPSRRWPRSRACRAPRWPCISSARRASRRWNTCCAGACNWRRAR